MDFLRSEIGSRDRIFGLLFMRKDGSMFGTVPEANLCWDDPAENPLPEDMKTRILNVPLGQTIWVGPISGTAICGFETINTPGSVMIAAWKFVDVRYGECYEMMLVDESIFEELFSALQDGKSNWYLFNEDQIEIWSTDQGPYPNPEQLIAESNSGDIFSDEDGLSACAFSMTMDSPGWTLVRKVSMESHEQVIRNVTRSLAILGGAVMLISLVAYELWLKRFVRQFRSLLNGIVGMGQGVLESTEFVPTSISEFYLMVVFDTPAICVPCPETARNGLISGLFCFYGGLHQAAPSCKIGRKAVRHSASTAPATTRAEE